MQSKENKISKYVCNEFNQFLKSENGATAIEYGLLAVLFAVGIITGAQGIGAVVTDLWNGVSADVAAGS